MLKRYWIGDMVNKMAEWFLHFLWSMVQPVIKIYYRFVKKCIIDRRVNLSYISKFEGRNRIGENSYFIQSDIGYASYIGREGYFYNTSIGKYSCIGPRVKIIVGQHPTSKIASIHPAFFAKRNVIRMSYVNKTIFDENRMADDSMKSVIIGNDVWIGADVLIMEGIKIGDGAIIAAGSLVLNDVEPYEVVGGHPAKHLRFRFGKEEINKLLKEPWWDMDNDWIRANAYLFEDINLLLDKLEEKHDK